MSAGTANLKENLARGIPGVGGGLFLARIILESVQRPYPGMIVLSVALICGLAGWIIGRWASRHVSPMWPALFLLIYVSWPQRAPLVGVSVAVCAILTWALAVKEHLPPWAPRVVDGLTLSIALLGYAATVAPDILAADSGEFQLVVARLGVAHPPGYPLYTLAGNLFTRIWPWGTPAYRLNLLSAILAACTVTIVSQAVRLWARQLGASLRLATASGLAAALALGTATTFWAQATTANIRMPTAFFTALALLALARFDIVGDEASADRALILLGFSLGVGLGHHPSLAFPAIFFVIYVVLVNPRLVLNPRRWWRAVAAGLLGLTPYIYLPIVGARGVPLAPSNLATWSGFLHHALARGFGGDMFAYANAGDLPHRLTLLSTLFPFQFNGAILLAAALGALGLLHQKWRIFVMLVGSLLLHAFVTITYRAPQTVEYLIPAYLPLVVLLGLLPVLVSRWTPPGRVGNLPVAAGAIAAALVIGAGLLNGWTHGPSFVKLAHDRSTREIVEPLLMEAPQGAIILADWRWVTPLWYLQQVEGQRTDVQVEYVYNVVGEEYWDTWERWIRAIPADRPVLLTHFYEFEGYTTEPWRNGFVIHPGPVTGATAPLSAVTASFGNQVELLGYSLESSAAHAGGTIELDLAWRALQPWEQPPSFTLRLIGAGEERLAQADQALDGNVLTGGVRFERFVLPLYPELAPGRYELRLGAYTVAEDVFKNLATSDGSDSLTLAEIDLSPRTQVPYTLHPLDVPFKNGPALVGVDYDRSLNNALRLYLNWRGPSGSGNQVQITTSTGAMAVASLPPIADEAYQTSIVNMPGIIQDGVLQLSLVSADGETLRAAGPWGWGVGKIALPAAARDARFVPVGGDFAVVGVSTQMAARGQEVIVDVNLLCLVPMTDDLAISVRLMDVDGHWLDRHDMQPAQGAIPTLKWIQGSRVVDRHMLSIPEGFTGDTLQAALVAYERFREITRPVLDGRFRDVPLGSWPLSD